MTSNPSSRPNSVRSATSPAARCPNRKLRPTTTCRAFRVSARTREANRSADSDASSAVNWMTSTPPIPSASKISNRWAMDVSRGGAMSGRITDSGCGSKVTATGSSPSVASATARSNRIRCPR